MSYGISKCQNLKAYITEVINTKTYQLFTRKKEENERNDNTKTY